MVHNRYLEGGGEDQSTDVKVALLRDHDIVIDLYTQDSRSIQTSQAFRNGFNAIWSEEAL